MGVFQAVSLSRTAWLALATSLALAVSASAATFKLVERRPDPHGSPRPFRGAEHVPLRTSLYCELEATGPAGRLDPASLSAVLLKDGKPVATLLSPGRKFVSPATGWIQARTGRAGAALKQVDQLVLYIEPNAPLEPSTKYEVVVATTASDEAKDAQSEARPHQVRWSFTTEAAPQLHRVPLQADFAQPPIHWRGKFFSGICNVVFCTSDKQFGPTYALMDEARKEHPRAWSYQRDFWMTGFEYRLPGILAQRLPNIVREKETRRIVAIEPHDRATLLKVEDFFGHEQYGIESNRPLSPDYHEGDEVLIADGVSDARAKVLEVDDTNRTVLVTKVEAPKDGWQIEYQGPLPTKEDPDAPGLFPPGGCYLRKFAPHGTPCYYWGRLDKEWDLLHRKHGRRLFVNFADAPGDLSRDGRSWTTVKDYAQWHAVAKEMAGHVIDRYGEDSLTFTWSVFNEPDLGPFFWRATWEELQTFYDYTTDAILRAFEDRGYDSSKVFIGGLELGGIFGTNLRLTEFLAHCSPKAEAKGAVSLNAAYADKRLDGKRSRRVEELCGKSGGKGAPCDFVSIHAYNDAKGMAAKLARAKEIALELDADYFANLWVNSHEACPEWSLPPDEAAGDSYLGNGYFSTWCTEVVSRQLAAAEKDPRYAFGETLITVWPPPVDLAGVNAVTRILQCDDDGDGLADRTVTVPYPTFHALNLLSDLGDNYWPLERQTVAGHVVTGFASRDEQGTIRVALFSHHSEDTQSRSGAEFEIELQLRALGLDSGSQAEVTEYRFDREHNSYFAKALEMRQRAAGQKPSDEATASVARRLASANADEQLAALAEVEKQSPAGQFAVIGSVATLAENAAESRVREAAKQLIARLIFAGGSKRPGLPKADVEAIQQLSKLQKTNVAKVTVAGDGTLTIAPRVPGNGLNMLVIKPVAAAQ